MKKPLIVLASDFGYTDQYVGVMKGIIYGIASESQVIDLTHEIKPHNIRQAAFIIHASYKYFPDDSIFVVVVDPGVGTERNAILAKGMSNKYYISPDNGTLSYLIHDNELTEALVLNKSKYRLPSQSTTFDGRDIFAPVAAYLASGVNFNKIGSPIDIDDLVCFPKLICYSENNQKLVGEIINIDRFGNIVTSITMDSLVLFMTTDKKIFIEIGWNKIHGINKTYSDVISGEYLTYIGSSGFLEIGIREGDAAKDLGAVFGQKVVLRKE